MSANDPKMKVAPNSKESEMMVLGCMLTSINSLNIAADGLEESDFYYTEHKIIFQVLKSAYKNDKPADVHLVCEELKRIDKLKAVGGPAYVATLAQYAGTSAFIEEYTELVKAKSILRKMIHAAQTVEKNALEDPQDVHVVLDDAQQMFFKISQTANPAAGILISDLLSGINNYSKTPYLKELQERQERFLTRGPEDPGITGLATHFLDLDRMINGLNNSNLIILAARPAMGKTAFALNIAENICFRNNIPVGVFSLEMTAEQLLHRIICSQAEVESDKIRTGALNGMDFQRIVSSVSTMQKHTMVIDDQPGLKITDLRARARRMKESHQIGLLIVDYLQLISGSGSTRTMENRQNEISEISRMLKNLARELDIPIICLSQLSRKVEDRTGHRPMMSDLRESGCLTGDTIIKDAHTGKNYTIKELADRQEQTPIWIHAIDNHLKMGEYPMVKAFYSGKKPVFKLKTRSGRSIKASANHPFLKLEGWTKLDQLKIGDKIGLPRGISSHGASNLDDQEIILLAHLLGDGCVLPNQPYHYTSADEINIDFVRNSANQLFNINGRLVKQENWFHYYLPSPYKTTHGRYHPITNWFNQLGIERVRSYKKEIPGKIFQCNREKIALFLHHLWSTDGNISIKKIINRQPSGAIYYASSSEKLARQVQHLLLNLQIQSDLSVNKSSKGYRDMYHVQVYGAPNQKKFLKEVGAAGKKGEIVPSLLQLIEEIKPNTNVDVIPREAWKTVINEAKQQSNMTWRTIFNKLGISYSGSILKNGISRDRLKRYNAILKSEKLTLLAEADVYWDEILEIEPLGIEDVFDATVDQVHNFVANDIIVHNSIEQDSDIVMFLLRREYYDPNDKPGMAELIVAKNRHGSVGSVNLTFIKELAQFRNYTPIHVSLPDDSFASL